jgi:hypothetical protein
MTTLDGNYFQTRLDKLGERRKQLDSVSVTYKRGAQTATIAATWDKTTYQDIVDDNVTTIEAPIVFIDAADLVLGGSATEPQRGDTITKGTDNFEVMPHGDESLFGYTSASRKRMRINLKAVA